MTFLDRLSESCMKIDLTHLPKEEQAEIRKAIELLPTVEEFMESTEGKAFFDEVSKNIIEEYYKNK